MLKTFVQVSAGLLAACLAITGCAKSNLQDPQASNQTVSGAPSTAETLSPTPLDSPSTTASKPTSLPSPTGPYAERQISAMVFPDTLGSWKLDGEKQPDQAKYIYQGPDFFAGTLGISTSPSADVVDPVEILTKSGNQNIADQEGLTCGSLPDGPVTCVGAAKDGVIVFSAMLYSAGDQPAGIPAITSQIVAAAKQL